MAERWTTQQVCAYLNIKPDTYHRYVVEQGAPAAVSREPGRNGQNLYDPAAVLEWHANRPGQGARTDLRESGD
jgi:hypothetical protein